MRQQRNNRQSSQQYKGMGSQEEEQFLSQAKSGQISIGHGQLSKPLPHKPKKDHREIIRDDTLKSCFPFADRTRLAFKRAFCCTQFQQTFIDDLKVPQRQYPPEVSRDYINNILTNKILQLKISQTSRLQLNSQVIHPFVKIHFVNKDTGCYLPKTQGVDSVTYRFEYGGYFKDGKWKSTENDIILPFSTTCVDFRVQGSSRGIWNQKFYINEDAKKLLTPDTIILFEILDFNHQSLIEKKVSDLGADNFYRVCWAYLRPIGLGKKHFGRNRLQLYRYKLDTRKLPSDYLQSFIPPVYYEFMWPLHEKYEAFLEVDLTLCFRPDFQYQDELVAPQNIFLKEKEDEGFIKKYANQIAAESKHPPVTKYKNLLNYYRIKQCKIPDSFVAKFPSAELGCMRLAMADDLLLACCSSSTKTVIKGFSLQTLKHIFTLRGHKQTIYGISVSPDQKHFVTVGSDYYAKIWVIPKQTGDFIDQENSDAYLIGKCIHPSYVYCGAIFQVVKERQIIVVTGCYDGYLRVWKVDLQRFSNPQSIQIPISRSQKNAYPMCITQGEGFIIVGDSIGGIHLFDVQMGAKLDEVCKKRVQLYPKQLTDDRIYAIHILNKTNIIVQCKDNIIRHYEISTGHPKVLRNYIGSQSQNYLIRSVVSPDNRYLISGSEDGRPVMWQTQNGQIISTDHLQLDIEGPIVDCCWSKKFNLVALCGYVKQCPIFLYGSKIKETDPQIILALMEKRQ